MDTETTATEQATQPTEAPVTEQAVTTETTVTEDPVLAELKNLGSRVDEALAGRESETAAQEVDLLDALAGEPAQAEAGNPEVPADDLGADPEAQRQLEDLERFIDQRAQAIVSPFIQEQREAQVRALTEKFPDITSKEVLPRVEAKMQELVRRSGNESLLTDAAVVELVYKAAKAELADAGAVPAGQAGENGASLETNAGQSQAGGSSDARDQYISEVFQTAKPRSLIG